MAKSPKDPKERLFERSIKDGDCIISTFHCGPDRYPLMKFRGKPKAVHRISWILQNGDIPKGMWVCHTCDNKKCINPDHLFLGTPQDNTNDMKKKKREDYWGRMHYSDEIADKAISMKIEGLSYREIGEKLKINANTVHSFFRRGSVKEKVENFYAQPKYTEELINKCFELKGRGYLHKEIGRMLKIPKRSLTRIFQKNNVTND